LDAKNIQIPEKLAVMEECHELKFEKMRKDLSGGIKQRNFYPEDETADYLAVQMSMMEKLAPLLRIPSTVNKNTKVLQHAMDYFKKQLSADEKKKISETIEQYRTKHVPLIVQAELISHCARM